MQTFLPYKSFVLTARCLDRQRLGKQRVEAYQILKANIGYPSRWIHHPAVKMWKGHEGALAIYTLAICREWISRGYKDTMQEKTNLLVVEHGIELTSFPEWLGMEAFHVSHQSNLIRKDPRYFRFQFPGVVNSVEYVWPVK